MKRTYYVGDLCHVFNNEEWNTVASMYSFYPCEDPEDFDPEGYLDIENASIDDMQSGRPFYILKTAFGDGCYRGSDGKDYSVDSGTIGCIAVDDIAEREMLEDAVKRGLGHLHEFEDFCYGSVGYDAEDSGLLYFADLDIQT
jgi:hypothetical protein